METQRIALFGATTHMGKYILNEALSRGYNITAFVPDRKKIDMTHTNLMVKECDAASKNKLVQNINGHDLVISTYQVITGPKDHLNSTLSLIDAVRISGIKRLIAEGYPGAIRTDPMIPYPTTAEAWMEIAEAQVEVLEAFENEKNLHWSYIHYPEIHDAVKKNNKPLIGDQLLVLSSEGKYWFHSERCAENILNEADYFMEEHNEGR